MAGRISGWARWSGTAAVALLVVSCAKDQDIGRPPEAGRVLALTEAEGEAALLNKYAIQKGDISVGKDGSFAGGKRSQFEGQKQVAFGGEWNSKSYGAKEYATASWGETKERETKSFDKGKEGKFRFASLFGGKKPEEAGKRSDYDGRIKAKGTVDTGAAYETSRESIARPEDAKAAWRRSVYPQPRIESLADVQRKSVEETRRLLGRDD